MRRKRNALSYFDLTPQIKVSYYKQFRLEFVTVENVCVCVRACVLVETRRQ